MTSTGDTRGRETPSLGSWAGSSPDGSGCQGWVFLSCFVLPSVPPLPGACCSPSAAQGLCSARFQGAGAASARSDTGPPFLLNAPGMTWRGSGGAARLRGGFGGPAPARGPHLGRLAGNSRGFPRRFPVFSGVCYLYVLGEGRRELPLLIQGQRSGWGGHQDPYPAQFWTLISSPNLCTTVFLLTALEQGKHKSGCANFLFLMCFLREKSK